jgi:hypothetical protein
VSKVLPDILALERATLSAVPAPRIAFDGGFVARESRASTVVPGSCRASARRRLIRPAWRNC